MTRAPEAGLALPLVHPSSTLPTSSRGVQVLLVKEEEDSLNRTIGGKRCEKEEGSRRGWRRWGGGS